MNKNRRYSECTCYSKLAMHALGEYFIKGVNILLWYQDTAAETPRSVPMSRVAANPSISTGKLGSSVLKLCYLSS